MNPIVPGSDAPQADIPLAIDSAALDKLTLVELIALRDAIYDSWDWPDVAIPIMAPIWEALIEATEDRILGKPLTTLHAFCQVIVAFSHPKRPCEDGMMRLRPHAEAVLDKYAEAVKSTDRPLK